MPPEQRPDAAEAGARRAGRVPTIFAMGGGGFTMEPENPALDDYVRTPGAGARAADLPAADRRRRLRGPDPPLPHGVRRPAVRADAHLAVPARLASRAAARPPARPGRDLRRRRLDDQPARAVARARARRDPARGVAGRHRARRAERRVDVLVRVGRDEVDRRARRSRAGSASCPARTRSTTTASPSAGPRSSRRSRRARSRPAGRSTTAPGCCSAAPGWPRPSRRGRAPAPTGSTPSTARPSRRRSSRGCSRRAPHADPASPLAVDEMRALNAARRGGGGTDPARRGARRDRPSAAWRAADRPGAPWRAAGSTRRVVARGAIDPALVGRGGPPPSPRSVPDARPWPGDAHRAPAQPRDARAPGAARARADRRRRGRRALRAAAGAGRAAAVPRAVEPRRGLRPRGPRMPRCTTAASCGPRSCARPST